MFVSCVIPVRLFVKTPLSSERIDPMSFPLSVTLSLLFFRDFPLTTTTSLVTFDPAAGVIITISSSALPVAATAASTLTVASPEISSRTSTTLMVCFQELLNMTPL
jgi:hypothetical protein